MGYGEVENTLMLTFPVVGPPVHQILGGAPAGPCGPHHLLQLSLHVLGRGFPRQLSFGAPTPPHHSLLTLEIRQIKFSFDFDFELIMRKTGNAIKETIKISTRTRNHSAILKKIMWNSGTLT